MDYKELLNDFPPRPITTEEQFNLTRNRLDEILDILFDRGFTQDERDYLTILGMVIEQWEEQFDNEFKMTRWEYFTASVMEKYYNWRG